MQRLIHRCAELHLNHIATSGDPFEFGSARPLDFGHWAAHKLEQLSEYKLRHGEAVAIGLALDVIYSRKMGFLDAASAERVLKLLEALGFDLYANELLHVDSENSASTSAASSPSPCSATSAKASKSTKWPCPKSSKPSTNSRNVTPRALKSTAPAVDPFSNLGTEIFYPLTIANG
jgi:hypothetical protein